MSDLHQFNPGRKSWKMYSNTITSISGDDLTITPYDGQNLILEVSGNNEIIFKKGDTSYNLADLSNIASSGGSGIQNGDNVSFQNVDISGTLNSMLVFDFANKRINPASPHNNGVINLGYKDESSRARFNEVHLKKLITTQINNNWRYRLYSDPTYSSDPFIIYSDQSGSSKFFSIKHY